jgi:hypothetical protein
MRFMITLLTASLAISGCQSVRSSSVATEHMRADITISVDGTYTAEVAVQLRHEDSSLVYVDLDRGERLVASSSAYQAELEPGFYDYRATLPLAPDDSLVSVGLERTRGVDAPYSVVELPTPFRLYPNAGVFSLAYDVIPLEWDRLSDDEMVIEIEGQCIWDESRYIAPFADLGVALIEPGDLRPRDLWKGDLCPLEITITRIRHGHLDRGFARGEISATQVRQMDILVTL